MTVRKYEYRELTKRTTGAGAQPYAEPRFEKHVNAAQVDGVHKKTESFHLDNIVVDQLGIQEREKEAQESRLRKELERRWEQAAEKAEVAGYTRGLEEGRAEAFKAELPRIKERVEKFEHLLRELDTFREKIFIANESFLMDLIAQVAGMVVLKEVQLDKDYVRRLVITLLQQLGTKEDLKIHLSEFDFANAELLRGALEKEFGKLSNTTIEASSDVPMGGCRIETRFGVVDASLAAQIENIQKSMKA
jgi:flagellar assembly protein FliH